jgi:rubrerythrin
VTVPAWFILLAFALAMAAPANYLATLRRRRRRRLAAGACPACGYDLRGAEHERCPECGEVVERHSHGEPSDLSKRK